MRSVAVAYCTGTNGRTLAAPYSHPILAVGPQNVGMNQKGIGLRRSLHDKPAELRGRGGRSLGGRGRRPRKYGHDKLVFREGEMEREGAYQNEHAPSHVHSSHRRPLHLRYQFQLRYSRNKRWRVILQPVLKGGDCLSSFTHEEVPTGIV